MTPEKATAEPSNPDPVDPALQSEQLRLLFRFSVVGHLATLLVIFILGGILWQDLARPALFMWFVATSLVAVGRYLLYKAFIKGSPPNAELALWEGRFIAGTVLAGVCWAVIGSALLPDSSRMVQRLSVVPYGRMQFVEVTSGPIERLFHLSTVKLHTAAAASDARIPGLEKDEAARLRDRLTELGESMAAGM